MKIHSVFDDAFLPYGRVIRGLNTAPLVDALNTHTPKPEEGTVYLPACPELEALPIYAELQDTVYGGMPIEIGYCNGTNTVLDCLEYHRSSEINIPAGEMILLVARQQAIQDGTLDSAAVEAFRVEAGTPVELYATTLHYAPCDAATGMGFRVAVVLPRDTNTEKPAGADASVGDGALLWARNKWLIARPESQEASQGAFPGLLGKQIDIAKEIAL